MTNTGTHMNNKGTPRKTLETQGKHRKTDGIDSGQLVSLGVVWKFSETQDITMEGMFMDTEVKIVGLDTWSSLARVTSMEKMFSGAKYTLPQFLK